MDRFGVVGLSWRQGGPQALARFALPVEDRGARLEQLAREIGVSELVYIATCNRVELTFVTSEDVSVSEYRRRIFTALGDGTGDSARELRAWHGEGAVEHVFLVACGLDSARLGETEILGQVRSALELSRSVGLAREQLGLLFDEALKLARRAQKETNLGTGRTSLAEIGLERVRTHLSESSAAIALVGVSAMTERCARSLIGDGRELLIVNRSLEGALALASSLGPRARALTLESFRSSPPAVGALISATAATEVIFAAPELDRLRAQVPRGQRLLCIDFATHPDVDPAAAAELDCERLGMEEVLAIAERNREQRLQESGDARELVDGALASLSGRLAQRRAENSIGALHDNYVATARLQVDKLLATHFGDLDEERRTLLRRFAQRLAKHFAHVPASGLREIAQKQGPEVVQEFFSHAEQGLATGLDGAMDAARLFSELSEEGER